MNEFGFEFTVIYGVIVIFGILQIILFFKLWGMTNDVRRISEKIGARTTGTYYQLEKYIWQLLLEGKKDKAIEFLNKDLIETLIKCISQGYSAYAIKDIKDDYRKYYKKLGVPFPEQIEKINTLKDLEQLF